MRVQPVDGEAILRRMAACPRRWAFDPYEEAPVKMLCPNCGQPIYDGDDYYYLNVEGVEVPVGCEACAGRRTARA